MFGHATPHRRGLAPLGVGSGDQTHGDQTNGDQTNDGELTPQQLVGNRGTNWSQQQPEFTHIGYLIYLNNNKD